MARPRTGSDVRKRGQDGFTLLEAVVAMSVMGLFFLRLPGALVVMDATEGANHARACTLLCAQEKMEELLYEARRGRLRKGTGSDRVTGSPLERMSRRWEVRASVHGAGLLHVRTECSCPWKGRVVSHALETIMVRE